MPFDLFKPDTWSQQDQTADTNVPADKPVEETLVACPVHGDMVTQTVADAHVAAEEERKQLEAETQAAEEKRIADEKARKAADEQQAITDKQNQETAKAQTDAQATLKLQETIPGTAGSQQFMAEQQQQRDILTTLQDQWAQVATNNEQSWVKLQPNLNPITPDMVTGNTLELKLGGVTVQANSQQEMSDLLRFITDNRGYLPTGGTPLCGQGIQSVEQYKLSVANEKALDTPERQAYQYWEVQQRRAGNYQNDLTEASKLLADENTRRLEAGLPEITNISELGNKGRIYAERVQRQAGRIASDEEIAANLATARNNYATRITERISDTGWSMSFNSEGAQEFTLPNRWKANFGAEPYYTDETGKKYTPQEISADPELMRRFSDAVTPSMVEQFKKETINQPEVIENLISRIADLPVAYALLEKAYPDLAKEGVIKDYLSVMQKRQEPKVTGAGKPPDPITKRILTASPQGNVAQAMMDTDWEKHWEAITGTYIKQLASSPAYKFAQLLKDPNKPDRLKALTFSIASSMIDTGKYALEHIGNVTSIIDEIYARSAYNRDWGTDKSYEVWVEQRDLTPLIERTTNSPYFKEATAQAGLSEEEAKKQALSVANPTKGEWLPWTNPLYWIGPGELKAAKEASAGNKVIAEMASMFARGEGMEAVVKFAKAKAPEIGAKPEALVDDALKLISNDVKSRMAPAEFVGDPVLRDPIPGEPFKPGELIQTPEGPKVAETPTWKKLEKGDSIPENPADMYFDKDTNTFYVKKTEQPIPAEGTKIPETGKPPGATPAGESGTVPPSEAVKPQGEAVKGQPAQPTAMSRDELTAQMKAKYPDSTPEQIDAAVKAQEAKLARTSIDEEINVTKTSVQDRLKAGIGQRGAVNDPEAKALYDDLVKLAGLYIKKGVLTVEDFAKELAMKVTPALQHAWDAAMGNTGKSSYAALDDATRAAVDSGITEARTNAMFETVLDEIRRVKKLQPADQEALRALRAQQGAGIRQAKASGLKGEDLLHVELSGMKGQKEKVMYKPLELPQNIKDAILDHADTVPLGSDFSGVRAKVAMRKIFNGEIPQEGELELLEYVYGKDFIDGLAADLPEIAKMQQESFADFLTKIYYNSLITLKSNIPNTIGNSIASILSPAERVMGAAVDAGLSVVQRKERQLLFKEAGHEIAGLWTGVPEAARAFLNAWKGKGLDTSLKGEGAGVLKTGFLDRVTKGKHPQAAKIADKVISFNTDMLNATDQFFKAINYHMALGAEAYRTASMERLTGEELMARTRDLISRPTPELADKALAITKEKLYQNNSKLADALIRIRDLEVPKTGGLQPLRLVLPFVRTPVNLVRFGLQRSPLGLLNHKMWVQIAQKDAAGATQLGQALLGTGIFTALMLYAKDGLISGAAPTDPAHRDEFYRQGKIPYALKIGDKWISYQRLEPFNQIFLQAANLIDAVNSDEDMATKVGNAGMSIVENMASQTFLTGLSLAMNAIRDTDRYGPQFIQQTVSGMVPGSGTLRQIAQTVDTTIREPQDIGQQVQASVPGLTQNVPAKVNALGEEQKRETPSWEPYQFATEKNDPITRELISHDIAIGFAGNSVNGIKLSDEQHMEYKKLVGETIKEKLTTVINSRAYASMRSEQQTDLLEKTITAARKAAATAFTTKNKLKK